MSYTKPELQTAGQASPQIQIKQEPLSDDGVQDSKATFSAALETE
jgi:hypothetical protein